MLDFDAGWKELQGLRNKPDDSAHWDKKALTFDSRSTRSEYAQEFLRLTDIQPGESVFDMGCGTGHLALELARDGHEVLGADFSAGMLEQMNAHVQEEGLTNLRSIQMSWEDDWEAFGVTEGCVDVAIASRSIAVADLRQALEKLTRVARRRAFATTTTSVSPLVDAEIMTQCNIPVNRHSRDFIYVFGLLAQAGLEPEVRYIHSVKRTTYADFDEAFDDMMRMATAAAAGTMDDKAWDLARGRVATWTGHHLISNPEAGQDDSHGGIQKALIFDTPRVTPWAFLSWNCGPAAADALARL